jgi:zinc/manganese transport system substrate-binding protein
MARAARVVAEELAGADPANAASYRERGRATARKFLQLKAWAQRQIAKIPKRDRKLVTAHAAFGYFCKEFGFDGVAVLGLGREDDVSPRHLAATIKSLREQKVRAVFPEDQANPKALQEIVRETGVRLGEPLIADGTAPGDGSTFEGMMKYNVEAIVQALAPSAQ